MSRIAGRSPRHLARALSRIAVQCVWVVAGGCALVEGASSPTADTRVMLGPQDVVQVPRRHEAARNYHCREGFLMCDGGAVTQQCRCSITGTVLVRPPL